MPRWSTCAGGAPGGSKLGPGWAISDPPQAGQVVTFAAAATGALHCWQNRVISGSDIAISSTLQDYTSVVAQESE